MNGRETATSSGSIERRPSTGARAAKATRVTTESAWREEDSEKRALLAEEGAALGSEQVQEGAVHGGEAGGSKKWSGREEGDWKELLGRAKEVGRQWKRIWDKEGLAGCVPVALAARVLES